MLLHKIRPEYSQQMPHQHMIRMQNQAMMKPGNGLPRAAMANNQK